MIKMQKRGISPVVATVILISIVIALGAIIFTWALFFLGEKITKDGESVNLVCDNVEFDASYDAGTVYIENIGNVPIYKINVVNEEGDINTVEVNLIAGGSTSFESANAKSAIPVLLGENEGGENAEYACVDLEYEL